MISALRQSFHHRKQYFQAFDSVFFGQGIAENALHKNNIPTNQIILPPALTPLRNILRLLFFLVFNAISISINKTL